MLSTHVQEYCLQNALYTRQVDVDEFCSAVPFDENFARSLFNFYDKNGDGWLRLSAVIQHLGEFESLPPIKKLRFIFEVVDTEGTGLITMSALHSHLKLWADIQSAGLTCPQVYSIANSIFTMLGNTDVVSIEEVIMRVNDNKALMSVIASVHENHVIAAKTQQTRGRLHRSRRLPFKLPRRFCSFKYLAYNMRKVVVFLIIMILHIFMSVYGGWKYKEHNWCVIIARGCGAALNLAVTMVIVFMLRYWWTLVRRTWMAKFIPMDNFLMFHKMLGVMVAVYSVIHTAAHIGNAILMTKSSNSTLGVMDVLFTTRAGVGYVKHSAYLSGWSLLFCLLILIIGSLNSVRQSRFHVFFLCHLFYLPFIVILIIHGPRFWKFFVFPGCLFVAEKIWSSEILKRLRYGLTYVEEVHLLPNGVVHLKMTRHRNFMFSPGDYIFLHIPVLQKYEWHPFTISSAPDDKASISCHIRTLGDWTKSLYTFFETCQGDEMVDSFKVEQNPLNTKSVGLSQGPPISRVRRRSTTSFRANPTLEKIEEADNAEYNIPGNFAGKRRKPPGYCEATGLCTTAEKIEELLRQESVPILEDGQQDELKFYTKKDNASDRRKLFHKSRRSTSLKSKSQIRQSISTHTSFDLTTNEINIVSKISDTTEKLQVYIDGPYATQSCRVFETEHAVLVATGIGVTPFASILYSILHRYRSSKSTCPSCKHTWFDGNVKSLHRLKKVDFVWINRDAKSFEWFVGLLTQLESQQHDSVFSDFLTIHLYMTSQPHKDDTRNLALQMALDRMCHQDTADVITGLKTRTKIGRPNWEELMSSIKKRRVGKVKVFFCGPTILANTIKTEAQNHGFLFCKEIF